MLNRRISNRRISKAKEDGSEFTRFGVLRSLIQPFSLLWRSQLINAEPQNIEQTNFEGLGRSPPSVGAKVSFRTAGGGTEQHFGACFLPTPFF